MVNKTLETIDAEKLEKLVDTYGLANVLETLSEICYHKAQHIETNWQDRLTAHYWEKCGRLLVKTATKPQIDQTGYGRKMRVL